MTRRAGAVPEETREAIIKSAEKEFCTLGFEKASLRRICANAGVTTGALYFFFTDKEQLFESVVGPAENAVMNILKNHFDTEVTKGISEITTDGSEDFIFAENFLRYYFSHREICDMVIAHRDHPIVADFFDQITTLIEGHTRKLIAMLDDSIPKEEIFNDVTVHWFSHLQLDAVMHICTHKMDLEQAEQSLKTMIQFLRGGFLSLISK